MPDPMPLDAPESPTAWRAFVAEHDELFDRIGFPYQLRYDRVFYDRLVVDGAKPPAATATVAPAAMKR